MMSPISVVLFVIIVSILLTIAGLIFSTSTREQVADFFDISPQLIQFSRWEVTSKFLIFFIGILGIVGPIIIFSLPLIHNVDDFNLQLAIILIVAFFMCCTLLKLSSSVLNNRFRKKSFARILLVIFVGCLSILASHAIFFILSTDFNSPHSFSGVMLASKIYWITMFVLLLKQLSRLYKGDYATLKTLDLAYIELETDEEKEAFLLVAKSTVDKWVLIPFTKPDILDGGGRSLEFEKGVCWVKDLAACGEVRTLKNFKLDEVGLNVEDETKAFLINMRAGVNNSVILNSKIFNLLMLFGVSSILIFFTFVASGTNAILDAAHLTLWQILPIPINPESPILPIVWVALFTILFALWILSLFPEVQGNGHEKEASN